MAWTSDEAFSDLDDPVKRGVLVIDNALFIMISVKLIMDLYRVFHIQRQPAVPNNSQVISSPLFKEQW